MIFQRGANDLRPGTDQFPSIEPRILSSKLRPEVRGTKDGLLNLPAANAKTFTTAENEIIEAVGDLRKKGLEHYENNMAAYASRIRAARAEREEIELRAGTLRNEMQVESDSWKGDLWNAQMKVTGFQEKIDHFRETHAIKGPPRAAKSSMLMIGLLSIVLMAEVALSGLLFAEKNEMGIVGGVGIAFIISGVNVLSCLLFGFGARFVRLRGFLPKAYGLLMIVGFFLEAIALNLTVAHFRDALAVHPWDTAALEAVASIKADPLDIESLNSLIVFVFGFVVCTIAFIEGAVQWLDPRPGYNRLFNDTEKAIDLYAASYREAQEELTKLFETSKIELQTYAQKFRSRVQSALDAVGGQSGMTRQLNTFIETCDSAANRLLTSYREANQAARKEDRPEYFDTIHKFSAYVSAAALDGLDTEEAKAEIAKIDEIVGAGVRDILETRRRAVTAFTSVEDLTAMARNGVTIAGSPRSTTSDTDSEVA